MTGGGSPKRFYSRTLLARLVPMVEKRLVYPGDSVGVAEEFTPGPGTFEEGGEVLAATIGYLTLDTGSFEARVERFTPRPAVVQVGDVVIGVVRLIKSSMCAIDVARIADQPDRQVGGDRNGTLHVSKAANQYIDNMEDWFRVRDIVRAEVIETDPSIQLTTKAPHLGVLKSYCPRCGSTMGRKGQGLVCPECDWKDTKKLADDFGEGHVL